MGFHSFWTVEHHFLDEYSHCSNPEVLYGHLSAVTKNLRLGYGVRLLPKPYNHPVRTAESVATLDLVSRRSRRVRHRPLVDARRDRRLRHRPARDARDVGRSAASHRRLLDQRRVRVLGQALVDAAAARAPEAVPGSAPADLGRDLERRRSLRDRLARPRAAVVHGRQPARAARGADPELPARPGRLQRAGRQVPQRDRGHVHDGALQRHQREGARRRRRVVRVVPEDRGAQHRVAGGVDGRGQPGARQLRLRGRGA